jgi:hypothetical protein
MEPRVFRPGVAILMCGILGYLGLRSFDADAFGPYLTRMRAYGPERG